MAKNLQCEESMNIPDIYNYLTKTRRDLWAALESVPDEALSRPLMNGERFHCIKDLLFHIATVEDGWINADIQRKEPLFMNAAEFKGTQGGPEYAGFQLQTILDYWRRVEQNTLAYLASLTESELKRVVVLEDSPIEQASIDGLLWHVMIHEMRHTAQIVVLLRQQGIKPPALDLLWYLPNMKGQHYEST